ncbi:hypothetical protein [Streptomyces sp. NBC_01443]|uniref:hypothetical protein n=1 Tax=Streptomyces sp. NBC_01443 TaxID=2903868 RepID=UPI002258C7E0|nr:hypothetical protein [Streptomyces sp. NBC_01443]MCX4625342.1 hypothetical protein [Streptomyces sp. NBC_01443]
MNTSTDRRAYPGAGLGRVGVDDRDRVGSLAHQRDTARVPGIADAARNAVSAEPLLLQRVHCPARGVLARLPKAGQRNPGGPALALDNRQDPAHHTTGHLLKPKTRLLRINEPPRRPDHLRRLLRPALLRFLPSPRRLLRLPVAAAARRHRESTHSTSSAGTRPRSSGRP